MIRRMSSQLGYWLAVFGVLYSGINLARIMGFIDDATDTLQTVLTLAGSLVLGVIGVALLLRDPDVRREKFWTWNFAPRTMKISALIVGVTAYYQVAELAAYIAKAVRTGDPVSIDARIGFIGAAIFIIIVGAAWIGWDSRKDAQIQDDTTAKN